MGHDVPRPTTTTPQRTEGSGFVTRRLVRPIYHLVSTVSTYLTKFEVRGFCPGASEQTKQTQSPTKLLHFI